MSFDKNTVFTFKPDDSEREELRRLCEERDRRLKAAGTPMKTIITNIEMEERKRMGLSTKDYITLSDFKKKVALNNPNFILHRKTLQQELDDKKLFEDLT